MEKTLLEEVQESINEIIKKAKEWFSNVGECDVNLMISCGAITENQIIEMYLKENSFKFLDYDSLLVIKNSNVAMDSGGTLEIGDAEKFITVDSGSDQIVVLPSVDVGQEFKFVKLGAGRVAIQTAVSEKDLEKTHEIYKQLKEIAMKYKTLIIIGEQKKEVKDYDLG